jgi:hypothetical protein
VSPKQADHCLAVAAHHDQQLEKSKGPIGNGYTGAAAARQLCGLSTLVVNKQQNFVKCLVLASNKHASPDTLHVFSASATTRDTLK